MIHILGLLLLLAVPSEDYFDRITVASDGRITHFQQMPISVYVERVQPPQSDYEATVSEAIRRWEEASQGLLRFERASDDQTADIRISWSQRPPRFQPPSRVAEATLVRTDDEAFHVDIQVNLRQWPTLKVWGVAAVRKAMVHELGHATGLWGHSPNRADVLYHASDSEYPTQRDINTLRRLYGTPIGTACHELALASTQAQLSESPNDAELHYLRGTILMDQGNYQEAAAALQLALEKDSSAAAYATRLGMLFEEQGRTAEAIQQYERSVKTRPTASLYGMLGTLHLFLASFERAADCYQQAIRMDRRSGALRNNLLAVYHRWGTHLLRENQYEKASQVLDKALGLYEFSPILNYDRGVAHEGIGEYQSAIARYEQALSLDSELSAARVGLASAWNNLGTQHTNAREWVQALQCYNTALEWDANCWEANRNLDMVHLQQAWQEHASGNLKAAIARYEHVLERHPESADAHHNLGLVYLTQERYPEALASLQKALALAPDSAEVRANLRYVRRQQWMVYLRGVFLPIVVLLVLSYAAMKWTYRRVERLRK